MDSGTEFSRLICNQSSGELGYRLALGKVGEEILRAIEYRPVLVFGPQRSGKTSSVVVPALLEWAGPALVTSVRYDVVTSTLTRRRQMGNVLLFDPAGIAHSYGDLSVGWSPLDGIDSWDDAVRRASGLCEGADVSDVGQGGFWLTKARQIMTPLIYTAAASAQPFSTVSRWLSLDSNALQYELRGAMAGVDRSEVDDNDTGERRRGDWRDTADYITFPESTLTSANESAVSDGESGQGQSSLNIDGNKVCGSSREDDYCLSQIEALTSLAENTYNSITTTASAVLAVYDFLSVQDTCDEGKIKLSDFLNGDSNTLYLCAPTSQQRLFRPLFTALAREVYDRVYEFNSMAASEDEGIAMLLCLDEAGNVARLEDLDHMATTAAGASIQLLSVFHDLSQMYTCYDSSRARLILNNHSGLLLLPGNRDPETNAFLQDILVDENVRGLDHYGWNSGDLRRMSKDKILCIYEELSPVLISARRYFEDPSLLRAAEQGDVG